jgi:hypothetical protein
MQATVDVRNSLIGCAGHALEQVDTSLEEALKDPLILEAVNKMARMTEGEKRFVLASIETQMRGKR